MRFIADGPDIPDDLLEKRDTGQVVFFCGAGVSKRAGMPDFVGLTRCVLDRLDPLGRSPAAKEFRTWDKKTKPVGARKPLDQIFNMLQMEYGRDKINKTVSDNLKISGKGFPKEHQTVVRLSTYLQDFPKIVTTNFDLLFEYAGIADDCPVFEPPTFPDLRHTKGFSGIAYLHGRLRTDQRQSHNYILSSSDLGRAYLAEGWATSFVRSLLEQYTVVLLGYQANDPPVDYLLQGLNDTSKNFEHKLYAFHPTSSEKTETKWEDIGVSPITYPNNQDNHSCLWRSLEAWAKRAENPEDWRARIVRMAGRGPRDLQPHERGQIAHVARTSVGAREFSTSTLALPAEWLCVFDSRRRLANAEEDPKTGIVFDPRAHYGLDDDPPTGQQVTEIEESRETTAAFDLPTHPAPKDHWPTGYRSESKNKIDDNNLIACLLGDKRVISGFRLSRQDNDRFAQLPPRLCHLADWIAKNAPDPVVAWWVAKQYRLHPYLVSKISTRLTLKNNMPSHGRLVWRLILESLASKDRFEFAANGVKIQHRIAQEGWTASVLGALEQDLEPLVTINMGDRRPRIKPPSGDWSTVKLCDIAKFEAAFPDPGTKINDVPDNAVPAVFALASRNLIRGLERLGETGQRYCSSMMLYPDTSQPGEHHPLEIETYVLWTAELMKRVGRLDPGFVKATISLWPTNDLPANARSILNQLRLVAWNQPSVFPMVDVAESLMAWDQDTFWNQDSRRELLFLLRDKWTSFPPKDQSRILERLLRGPPPRPNGEPDDYHERRGCTSVSALLWLKNEGCSFPDETTDRIAAIQSGLGQWNDDSVAHAADDLTSQVGQLEQDTDASIFDGVPLSRIVPTALRNTGFEHAEFRERRPFEGLVETDPDRALSALEFTASQNEHPAKLWKSLVRKWPPNAFPQTTQRLCEQLMLLPIGLFDESVKEISEWMEDHLPTIATHDETLALDAFDCVIERLTSDEPDATGNGFGQAETRDQNAEAPGWPPERAMSSPTGRLTWALISMLASKNLPQNRKIPVEFARRLEGLSAMPGEKGNYAVCLLSRQLRWLHHIDPLWVKMHMIDWFALDRSTSRPAWNGLLSCEDLVGPELFDMLRNPFLQLFPGMYEWRWDADACRRAHQWLAMATIWHLREPIYPSFDQALAAMHELSENGLSDVINHLKRVGEGNDNGWTELVIPFLSNAWPQELRFNTERTSAAFVSMLSRSGEAFPRVFEVTRDFLQPVDHDYLMLHGFYRDAPGQRPIASRFPAETLDLMNRIISEDPPETPHGLGDALALVSKARPDLARDPRYVRLQNLLAAK